MMVSVCACVHYPSCCRSVLGCGSEGSGHPVCRGWCQQAVPVNSDSISAGIWGNWREKEEQAHEGTLEGLFLWVTVLLLLSPLVPLIENQTEKKSLSYFTPLFLQFCFLAPPPLSLKSLFLTGLMCHHETVMEIHFSCFNVIASVAAHGDAHLGSFLQYIN